MKEREMKCDPSRLGLTSQADTFFTYLTPVLRVSTVIKMSKLQWTCSPVLTRPDPKRPGASESSLTGRVITVHLGLQLIELTQSQQVLASPREEEPNSAGTYTCGPKRVRRELVRRWQSEVRVAVGFTKNLGKHLLCSNQC